MSSPERHLDATFAPRRPGLVAAAVYAVAALTLCWPMLGGRFLLGDDQFVAGYAFRHFASESLKATGSIPQWNPYLFGGLPYIGAMHGDLFYPVSLALRWLLPLDTAMNIGFYLHLVIAGTAMYALLRGLRTSWTGALVGGLSYELTGIVASMVNPGHDGKLFLSALAPLAFLALVVAIRRGRWWGYGLLSLVVGLGMFAHFQMTYYLLVACGLWTLWLVIADPERRPGLRWPVALAAALGAVLLGLALSAVQTLPFIAYLPYAARGVNSGWEYATGWAMPVEETVTTILPQFNGVLQGYWGQNFVKLHTEYLGAAVVLLAALGLGDRRRGNVRWALVGIAVLFMLVAWGGHTPFYRLWYEAMPMMKKVRAAGMAWYLPALVTAVFAGWGAERLVRGEIAPRTVLIGGGILAAIGLLGAVGALQGIAEALARAELVGRATENGADLRAGGIRLLLVALVAAAALWAVADRRIRGVAATTLLAVVVLGDLWSVDRLFFNFKPAADQLFTRDPVVQFLEKTPQPFRVFDPLAVYAGNQLQGSSILMAYDLASVLGYHGNELRFYDDLLGGKGSWQYFGRFNPALLDLTSTRFVLLPQQYGVPGFHQVLGPVETMTGSPAYVYESDAVPPYARVLGAAAKIPDQQIVPTVVAQGFPYRSIALYADTAGIAPPKVEVNALPPAPAVIPTVAQWEPGRVRIALAGRAAASTYLLLSENWYPDWHARIDGREVPVLRADNTFLSVVLPPGARAVEFWFRSDQYATGKLVTGIAALFVLGLLATPLWRRPVTSNP